MRRDGLVRAALRRKEREEEVRKWIFLTATKSDQMRVKGNDALLVTTKRVHERKALEDEVVI